MHAIDLNTIVTRRSDLVSAPMDGEIVMMDAIREQYFGLGGIGPRIWELLESSQPVNELCDTLCQEFRVEPEDCRSDTLAFVGELVDIGLVNVEGG